MINYDQLWSIMINYDQLWSIMINYDQLWSIMINYDQLWSIMINSDQFWSILINSDQFWSIMINYDQLWSIMINYDQLWSIMINYDQLWSIMINYDHMFLLNSIDANIDDRSNVLNRSTTSRIGPGNRIANPLVFLLPVPAQLSDTTRLCAFKCHFRSSRYKTRFAPLSWLAKFAKDQGNPNHTSNSLHISAHICTSLSHYFPAVSPVCRTPRSLRTACRTQIRQQMLCAKRPPSSDVKEKGSRKRTEVDLKDVTDSYWIALSSWHIMTPDRTQHYKIL